MSAASSESGLWKPKHSPWLITISVLLATFMEVLDTSIANVSLPHIAGNLSATTDESTWVLTSYLISNAVILSAAGWLSRYFGRKRYLAFSVLLFTISSAFCGAAHSLGFLVLARIFQGLGGGGLQPIAQAILLESFPPKDRGVAMAAYGTGIVVAPIIGPTLGGWITDNYTWRWIFYINIPIGLIGLMMQQAFIEDPPYLKHAVKPKIDYTGFALLTLTIGVLQVILDKGQQSDWFDAAWICWAALAVVVFFIAFVVWELRIRDPIVNLRILKNANFATASTLMALLGAVLYGSTVILPIFMQVLLGYPAFQTGLAMTPRGVGSFVSMLIIGRLVRIIDSRLLIVVGFAGIAVSSWFLTQLNLSIGIWNIAWPLVLNGLSMGFIFVPMTTLSVATLRQDEIYQATGLYSLMRNTGGSIGISLLVALQTRLSQGHQTVLVGHLPAYGWELQQRIQALGHGLTSRGFQGADSAMAAAGLLYRQLIQQADMLSFNDCFRGLAALCVLCAPLVLLFRKGKPGGGGAHAMID